MPEKTCTPFHLSYLSKQTLEFLLSHTQLEAFVTSESSPVDHFLDF